MTYGVVVLLQQTTLSNTGPLEYEPGKEPATIGMLLVVNGTYLEILPFKLKIETLPLDN